MKKFNHKAEKLSDAVGISSKREGELKSVIKSGVLECGKASCTLEFVNKAKMSPVEKIFVAFNLGRMGGRSHMPSLPIGMGKALEEIEGMIKIAEAQAKKGKKPAAKKGKK